MAECNLPHIKQGQTEVKKAGTEKCNQPDQSFKRPSLKVLESADSDVCATQAGLGLASDTFHQFGGFNVSM